MGHHHRRREKYPCVGLIYPDQIAASEARGTEIYICLDGHFHVSSPTDVTGHHHRRKSAADMRQNGVDMSTAERVFCLQITEANHAENQFYFLGGAGFRTEDERRANLATIPTFEHNCHADDRCYMLDVLDADDGFSVIEEREISAATAKVLLGVTDLTPLRDAARLAVADMEATLG